MWRSIGLTAAGLFYGFASCGVARVFGGGLGHGTLYFARLTITPLANSDAAFDAGSLLPLAGVVVWGLSFSAAGSKRPQARTLLVLWMLLHYANVVAMFLSGVPEYSGSPWILVPYWIGQVA